MTASFLPLTIDAARRADAPEVLRNALLTDRAAAECWTVLLAGCDFAIKRGLDAQLRKLSEATAEHVGTRWWFADGSVHRKRVARAQENLVAAIAEGDGQEFALAFVGYDNAMAGAVVCAGIGKHRRPVEGSTA
ncbi:MULTISPECIES: hypothetical protein [Amycolatopsis]|uniref:Uncharacterized protein n=1 Tax=Amycolatopsis japonica TaxID=208439 RepID=A0A075ULS9_9PSEU|nr:MULTISPECIES: hypothetical protein [Amycolatopsis]AIG73863.1 Hypothetical protein AJAP_04705 [Amycolatopsis japonica]OKJ97320.1 hypothetical protein AMK34_09920 [Amycolatopsis sp. CB00013]